MSDCCSCHINPPCNYCVESYECVSCNEIKHPDEAGENFTLDGDIFCDDCANEMNRNKNE
jgi:hypothetical protein